MAKKTSTMLRVEREYGEELETLLPKLINEYGYTEAAGRLGISKSSINYWRLKLGIEVRQVALVPGERLEIRGKRHAE